ncbi:MAG: hypothetical protein MJ113_05975 [Lachnospiraceae bacterium]|nr:hypothetical protein [Lachnospiraceae bacterium]
MPGNDENYLDSLLNQVSGDETENTLRSYIEDKERKELEEEFDVSFDEVEEAKEESTVYLAKEDEIAEDSKADEADEANDAIESIEAIEIAEAIETNNVAETLEKPDEESTFKVEEQLTDEEMLAAIDADVLMLDEGEELPLFEGIEENLNPADFAMQEELREKLNPELARNDSQDDISFVFDETFDFANASLDEEIDGEEGSDTDIFVFDEEIDNNQDTNFEVEADFNESSEEKENFDEDITLSFDEMQKYIDFEDDLANASDSKGEALENYPEEKVTKQKKTKASKKDKIPKSEKKKLAKESKKEIDEESFDGDFASEDYSETGEDIVIEIPDSGVKAALEELGMQYGSELPLEEIKDFNPTFDFDNILERPDAINPSEYMSSDFNEVFDEIVGDNAGGINGISPEIANLNDGTDAASSDSFENSELNDNAGLGDIFGLSSNPEADDVSDFDITQDIGMPQEGDNENGGMPELLDGFDDLISGGEALEEDSNIASEEPLAQDLNTNDGFGDVLSADLANLMSLTSDSEDEEIEEIEEATLEEIGDLGEDESSSFSFDAMPEISDTDSDLKDLFGAEFIDEMESSGFESDDEDEYGLTELEDGEYSEYDVGKEIFGNKKIPASKLKAEKTPEQIEAEKKAKKEAKEAAKALKAEEKEAAKAEKDRIKQEKQKLALVLKEEKKQKKLEALKEAESEEGKVKINKAGVVVILCILGIAIVLSIFGSSIVTYNLSLRHANQSFERKEYNDAYDEICGLKIKSGDKELYDKVMTVMFINKQLNSYINYSYLGDEKKALDSLIKGLQKYDKYFDLARRIGIQDDVDYVRSEILKCLEEDFDLDETSAMILSRMSDKDKYSLFVDEIVNTRK